MSNLDLGWCQSYEAIKYHMIEAYKEKNLDYSNVRPDAPIVIFSQSYYNDICSLNHEKIYDYCFIGSIRSAPEKRKWVIDFAKTHFTEKSIFVNTDHDPNWTLLGVFDKSHENLGYCPKNEPNNQTRFVQFREVNENIFYFQTMCQSKFILNPAGDAPWSFRFYETLLCKSLPIVENWHHTYRTAEESKIPYKYLLFNDIHNFNQEKYQELIDENTKIFETYHMLN